MNKTLVILQEECAELIHIISKIHRFGMESRGNRRRLIQEVGDVVALIEVLMDENIMTRQQILDAVELKHENLKVWGNTNI